MSKMKNMVILKQVNSNIVEEAIVIFKENAKILEQNFVVRNCTSQDEKSVKNDLCVKEAEVIINDYISKIENKTNEQKLKLKCKYLKIINIVLVIATIIFAII